MFLKKKREKNNSIREVIIPSTHALVLSFTMVWPYFGMNCEYNFKN